ncbi:MAG TPA: TetR/AcrR family transcriptional regulator [Pseudogracilibacillus sp.]|nr:TetR/AcrR family transcriptional regulator [Pseudogracilibacillus sp.]
MREQHVVSSIKDSNLVEMRRNQIIKSAITLFKQKGFHRTTTREIAKEAGFSIGTLYEYIRTKEDVLILVYESINDQVYEHLEALTEKQAPSLEHLVTIVDSYYRFVDEMQDEVLILYQETKALDKYAAKEVFDKERKQVLMLRNYILTAASENITEDEADILANNIFIHGHMWGFRRWMLQKNYTIDQYIHMQTKLLLRAIQATP